MLREYDKYQVLFGAFLVELAVGSYYITATTKLDIENYKNQTHGTNSFTANTDIIWISNSIVIGMGVTLSFGGYLEKKIGSLKTILIGGWLLGLNICLMYFTLKLSWSIIIITYGFLGGCGSGIAYGVALGLPIHWFHKNRGLILGITISGFGLSPAIFDILRRMILYVNNEKQIERLPLFFLILGLSFVLIQGIAVFLISRPVFNKIKENKLDSKSIINSNDDLSNISSSNQIQPHHIIFEFDFWILWLIMFLNNSCDSLITSLFYDYTKIHGSNYQIIILSVIGALFNFLGRLILGHLVEKFSFKKVMLSMTLSNLVFIGTIPAIKHSYNNIAYAFWFGIINFSNGGNFSVFPTMFLKLFGIDNFVFNYGMLYTSTSVSSTVVSLIIMYSTKMFYNYLFIIGGVISFLAGLLTLLFRGKSLIIYK